MLICNGYSCLEQRFPKFLCYMPAEVAVAVAQQTVAQWSQRTAARISGWKTSKDTPTPGGVANPELLQALGKEPWPLHPILGGCDLPVHGHFWRNCFSRVLFFKVWYWESDALTSTFCSQFCHRLGMWIWVMPFFHFWMCLHRITEN